MMYLYSHQIGKDWSSSNNIMKLSSGREIKELNDIVGIDLDSQSISYGYDGGIWVNPDHEFAYYPYPDLTKDELIEIADIMIKRWERFKQNQK